MARRRRGDFVDGDVGVGVGDDDGVGVDKGLRICCVLTDIWLSVG